jgi:ubiquinone/menaquinone biosynthesis C-methylase UbiE
MNVKPRIKKAFGAVVSFYGSYMEETGHVTAQRKIFNRLTVDGLVLDVATGTGIMIEGIDKTVGIDISMEMVREAKRKYPNKEFVVGDVEYLPFKSNTFDFVISCLAFSWFQDKRRALEEMLRVSMGKVFIVEEEGTPVRKRIEIPEHLALFFEEIERFEMPISAEELDKFYYRVAEADIDGSHKFVAWAVKKLPDE